MTKAKDTASAPTEDRTDETHAVENADAGTTAGEVAGGTNDREAGNVPDEVAAARESDAGRRAVDSVRTEAELAHGVDPISGGEKSVDEARADGVPVMVPQSKGDIRTDVTFPRHIQAPPVEQVAGDQLTKANSSTAQRVAAQRQGG